LVRVGDAVDPAAVDARAAATVATELLKSDQRVVRPHPVQARERLQLRRQRRHLRDPA
jgi:hypothetical protein